MRFAACANADTQGGQRYETIRKSDYAMLSGTTVSL
jgi:hypothetical protein